MTDDFKARVIAELDTSKLEDQLNDLAKGRKIKINVETGNTHSGINRITNGLRDATKTSTSLGTALRHALGIGSTAAIAIKAIREITKAAHDAVEAVKDIDSSVTNIRLATGKSYEEALKLVKTYNEMGQSLGATTKEISDGAVTWLRQGRSIADTNTLIQDSMILSKVGMLDASDAATYLTSAMKGYGVEANNALSIVDKLTAVDAHAAVNAGGLAEAMSRTANTANDAGVSMDKLIGYAATIGEVTQKSMTSVGESLKTIFTRMRDIKGGKLKLIDDDGTEELLSDVEITLNNVGIDLRKTVDEFEDSGDVLDSLAAKWDSLSSVQQAALAKAFAGTRQQENFRVLMNNYDNAKKYMEIAANSAGTAEKKFAAYADSIEAKSKSLQAAFESLAVNTISPSVIGGITEATTAFVNFLDKTNLVKGSLAGLAAVGAIAGFTRIATAITSATMRMNDFNTALTILKAGNIGADEMSRLVLLTNNLSASQLNAVISSEALSNSQRIAILMANGMSEAEAKAALSSLGLAGAEGTAATATHSLSGALKGLWATLKANPLILIATGVAVAVSAFSTLKRKAEEAHEAVRQTIDSFKEQQTQLRQNQSDFNKLVDRYSELSKGVNALGDNVSLTTDEYDEYLSVCNKIADTVPSVVDGFDSTGNAIINCKDNVVELTNAYNDLIRAQNNTVLNSAKDIFGDFRKSANKALTGTDATLLGDLSYDPKNVTQSAIDALSTILYSSDINQAIADNIIFGTPVASQIRKLIENAGIKQGFTEKYNDWVARAVRENRTALQAIVDNWNRDVSASTDGIKSLAEAYVSNSILDSHSNITPAMQSLINQIIEGYDFDFYNQFRDVQELYSYLNNLLAQFDSLGADGAKQVELVFDLQAKYNNGECTVGEYISAINDLKILFSSFDDQTQKAIMLSLGYNDNGIQDQIDTILNHFATPDKSTLEDWIYSLSRDDFEIAYQIALDPTSADMTLADLQARIQELKEVVSKPVSISFDTFVTSDTIDNLNDIYEEYEKIKTAIDDLESGATTPDALIVENPAWAKYAKDMPEGLRKAAEEARQKAEQELDAITIDPEVEGAQEAFDAFKESYLKQFDDNSVTLPINIEVETTGAENVLNAIKSSVSETGLNSEQVEQLTQRYSALAVEADWIHFKDVPEVEPVEVETEASDPSSVIEQVQEAADNNPIQISAVDISLETSDLLKVGSHLSDLSNAARIKGGAASEVTALTEAYMALGDAKRQAANVDMNDASAVAAASGGLAEAAANFQTAYANLQTKLGDSSSSVEVDADTQAALNKIQAIADSNPSTTATIDLDSSAVDSYTPQNKSAKAKYTVDASSVYSWTPPRKTGTVTYTATGAGHAKGTSSAESGMALVDEENAELIEHKQRGTYELGTNKGPRLTQLDAGDVVHTASETKSILQRIKGVKVFSGGAFSSGTGPSFFTSHVSGSGGSSGGGHSSSSGGGSSSKKNDKEAFDFIEVAIDRIERLIKNLGRVAESTFKTLNSRLSATGDEIRAVGQEIQTQRQGYERYLQEADSVKLSDSIKEMVRNGTIDIRQYDKDTKELIEDYRSWYEKAISCADAVDELNEKLAELYEGRYEAIQTDFENQLEMIEHTSNTYSNMLDDIQERGYMGGAEIYRRMQDTQRQTIDTRREELARLQEAMAEAVNSGAISRGSEAWYKMQQEINACQEAIQKAETDIVSLNNKIRQLNWDAFDYLQETISEITSEANFLINLMDSSKLYEDNGQFSSTGMAQMGLHAMNYDVYMRQADQYAEEMARIDSDLANDPNNRTLLDRRKELLGLQRDAILAAEDEKDAVADMVEEGINKELDALQKLIDAYEDQLDSQKDLYDYQKKTKKQTQEIASLQKQLAAYQGDTSEENRARLQKLQVSLSDAVEELEETQYSQYIKDQKKLLSDLYDDYEEKLNARLDDIDALMNQMIDVTNANAADIAQTIRDECQAVGYTLSDGMSGIWTGNETDTVISRYGDSLVSQLTTLNTVISSISSRVATIASAGDVHAQPALDNPPSTPEPEPSTPTPTPAPEPEPEPTPTPPQEQKKQIKIVNGQWWLYRNPGWGKTDDIVHRDEVYDYVGEQNNNTGIIYRGQTRWFNSKGAKKIGFSQGGFVADLQRMAYQNGDDIVSFNSLKRGEAVLTPEQTQQLSRLIDSLPEVQGIVDISKYMSALRTNGGASNNNVDVGGIQINIPIENVQDYNDFVTQLQKDDKFERMIQDMTIGRINGGSQFAKRKYNWQ